MQQTGRLLECLKLNGKFINTCKSETKHMLRGNIATTMLTILFDFFFSVKGYDKSNFNAFTLSIWEHFQWGNNFDLHKTVIGFEIQFLVFFRMALLHRVYWSVIYEAESSNRYKLPCAPTENSDQPEHARSLI